jgi:hypothetical protein
MKRIMTFLTATSLIAFAYVSTGALAAEMKQAAGKIHEEATLGVGKEVKNTQGQDLGTVKDFVRDSDGKISFAIISIGGFMGFGEKKVAVPYSALTYDKEGEYFTCALSKDQLSSAPEFKDEAQLRNRSFAEEVYRHFGERPYWTETPKGTENPKGMGAPKATEEPKGTKRSY